MGEMGEMGSCSNSSSYSNSITACDQPSASPNDEPIWDTAPAVTHDERSETGEGSS